MLNNFSFTILSSATISATYSESIIIAHFSPFIGQWKFIMLRKGFSQLMASLRLLLSNFEVGCSYMPFYLLVLLKSLSPMMDKFKIASTFRV